MIVPVAAAAVVVMAVLEVDEVEVDHHEVEVAEEEVTLAIRIEVAVVVAAADLAPIAVDTITIRINHSDINKAISAHPSATMHRLVVVAVAAAVFAIDHPAMGAMTIMAEITMVIAIKAPGHHRHRHPHHQTIVVTTTSGTISQIRTTSGTIMAALVVVVPGAMQIKVIEAATTLVVVGILAIRAASIIDHNRATLAMITAIAIKDHHRVTLAAVVVVMSGTMGIVVMGRHVAIEVTYYLLSTSPTLNKVAAVVVIGDAAARPVVVAVAVAGETVDAAAVAAAMDAVAVAAAEEAAVVEVAITVVQGTSERCKNVLVTIDDECHV